MILIESWHIEKFKNILKIKKISEYKYLLAQFITTIIPIIWYYDFSIF